MNRVFRSEPVSLLMGNFPLLCSCIYPHNNYRVSHEPSRNQRVLYLPKGPDRLSHVIKDKVDIQEIRIRKISHSYAPSKPTSTMDMTDRLSGCNKNALKRVQTIIKYLYVSTSTDPSSASIPESGTVSQRYHPITTTLLAHT